jgi:hypothetical protein
MTDKQNNELRKEQLVQLRQRQFQMAMDGDVRLLIWLGKQYLGQKDNPEVVTDELCDGFDLQVIDENFRPIDNIKFAECNNKDCKCKDCGRFDGDI